MSRFKGEQQQTEQLKKLRSLGQGTGSHSLVFLNKYSKILGQFLIDGFHKFVTAFKRHLTRNSQDSLEDQADRDKSKGSNVDTKTGFKVNFQQFKCPDSQLVDIQPKVKPAKKELKGLRNYAFNCEDYVDEDDENSSNEDLRKFMSRLGTKRVKKDPSVLGTRDDGIVEVLMVQTPEIENHFVELYNQVQMDYALQLVEIREKEEKQKKKEKAVDESMANYKKYFKSINQGMMANEVNEEPRKKLANLNRLRRERVEQRPPRKMTHIEKEAPQIYNVEKVLECLDQQFEDSMNQKKKEKEQELRVQLEAKRLEQQAQQKQRKILEAKLDAERKQAEIQRQIQLKQKESQIEKNSSQQIPVEKEKSEEVKGSNQEIEEKPYIFEDNSDEEHSFGLIVQKEIKKSHSPKSVSVVEASKSEIVEVVEQKSQIFSTPPRQKSAEPEQQQQQQQQVSPVPSVAAPSEQNRGSAVKNNPFIRNSPAKLMTLQDLIKNDQKSQQFTSLLPSPSTNIFSQINPSSVPSLFGAAGAAGAQPQTQLNKQQVPPVQSHYTSPSHQTNFPINQGQSQGGPFGINPSAPVLQSFIPSPNNLNNPNNPNNPSYPSNSSSSYDINNNNTNSINNPGNNSNIINNNISSNNPGNNSNIINNNISSNNPGNYNSQGILSQGQPGQPFPSNPMGSNIFTGNANAAKMFESNIFMGQQPQQRSLFSDPPPTPREQRGGGGRNKKPVRIS